VLVLESTQVTPAEEVHAAPVADAVPRKPSRLSLTDTLLSIIFVGDVKE
jgi:hypothetical protein